MTKRIAAIFCGFCILFTFLYLRIAVLGTNSRYIEAANDQSSYTLSIPTERATIYDCNLNPVVNQSYRYIAAVVPTPDNIALLSDHAVNMTEADLQAQLREKQPFLCEVDTYELAQEGIEVFPVHNRYESEQIANHLIGYLDASGAGVTGLEAAYDDLMTAGVEATQITYTLDGFGQCRTDVKPEIRYGSLPSDNIVLTIDSEIQALCEQIGSKHLDKGAIVVMECATGKLRAVCSFPTFSQENLEEAISDTEGSPMLNRAFNAYSVGSTFKVVTTAAALTQGLSPTETYTCEGSITVGENTFHCHQREGHGVLDVKQALMVSCNPFFIHLGQQIQPKLFLRMASDLSFGKQYELAPGMLTASGQLPNLEEMNDAGSVANFSFGQGILTATPVQLAQMMSSVANDGFTPTPILIEGHTADGKAVTEQPEVSGIQAMSAGVAQILQNDLTACVMEREAQYAKPSTVTAAGKTGTAQTGIYDGDTELCNGWFAGYFPAEEPKYAVAVLAENADTGNVDASPVFQEIADGLTVMGK